MGIKITKPKPNRRNTLALTIYCLLVSALLLILKNVWAEDPSSFAINDLSRFEEISIFSKGMMAILVLWLFFAGIVILSIYAIFISHQHHLKKPKSSFSTFYFIFIAWLALFLSTDLLLLFSGVILQFYISSQTALIINLSLTFLINFLALLLIWTYVTNSSGNFRKKLKSFQAWLSQKIRGNRKYNSKQLILWGLLGYIAFYPLIILTTGLNTAILKLTGRDFPVQPIVEFSLQNKSLLTNILIFISITILAPFFEEIIMRGLVFRGLTIKLSLFKATLLSGLIFAIFHFNSFSLLPITILGALLAWLYSRTGSLIPSIIAHAIFNGLNFALLNLLK